MTFLSEKQEIIDLDLEKKEVKAEKIDIKESSGNIIENIDYKSIDANGNEYNLHASRGEISNDNENIIILDGIQDPGNLGTIFRTCIWYGIKSIILTTNTIDPFNLKCIRSGMGAHFYLNNIIQDNHINVLKYLKNHYKTIYVADMKGNNLEKIKSSNNWALILGSEAHGINSDFKQFDQITISKIGKLESLNVSVAAGIIINKFIFN